MRLGIRTIYAMVAASEKELNDLFNEIVISAPRGTADGMTLDAWRTSHRVGTTEEASHQLG